MNLFLPVKYIIRVGLTLVLVGGCLIGWKAWSRTIVYYPAVHILADQVLDLAMPVFAQFTVTQTLYLPTAVHVQALVVPMYVPDEAKPIRVRLLQAEQEVAAWQLSVAQHGEVDITLPLAMPMWLQGDLSVLFDGSQVAYADKNQAPRLFIESEDKGYPGGHYFIAQNAKSGDVGLKVIGQQTNGDMFRQAVHAQPLVQLPKMVLWVLFGLMIVALPWLL